MLTKTYIIMLASYAILKVTAKVWIQYTKENNREKDSCVGS